MKIVSAIAVAAVVTLLGVIAFAYSGLYDVAASSPHSGFTSWLLSTTSNASVRRRSQDVSVPDMDDEALVLAGINDFDAMCAGCHGAPGKGPEAMGLGLNPPAPDLALVAEEKSPAEMFWVTRNGIKMTGMPAWGATHDDSSIWPVVAFMTRLPDLDEAGYQKMLQSAAGHGHHAADSTHSGHSHDQDETTPNANVHVHDDGSTHIHESPAETDDENDHEEGSHEHHDH